MGIKENYLVKNYTVAKVYETLVDLGNVKNKQEFSAYYLGRNTDYFSMILRSNRQLSLGAIHRLAKTLNFKIESEEDFQVKKKLNECISSLQTEIMIRLDRQASLRKSSPLSQFSTFMLSGTAPPK